MPKHNIAIIQARMGSTRLPHKMMLSLHGTPIIEWVVRRVLEAKLLDKIIVAIPNTQADNVLEQYIHSLQLGKKVTVFRGSQSNVLHRFYHAVKDEKPSNIIRVCADNPVIEGKEIDHLIEFFNQNSCDYAYNHIPKNNLYPDGFGAEIISLELLKKLNDEVVKKEHKEHCLSYIIDNPKTFSIKTFNPKNKKLQHPELKFDIDTFEDYYKLEMKKFSIKTSAEELVQLFI
jgi:spore coat polysaccharide biosynthesis protein SpsF